MRFISRYGKNGVAIRAENVEAYANGTRKVTQTAIAAYFQPYLLTPEERQLAIDTFHFNGSYQEQDEVTIVPPDYRIGLFDSRQAQAEQGWSDEERLQVEAKLQQLSAQQPMDLIVVVEAVPVAPWPNYDVFAGSVLDLMAKVVEDGYTLEAVLAYEAANQARPEVIGALEELLEDQVPITERNAEEVFG